MLRIEKIAKEKPQGIILREKDLSEPEYEVLAEHVLSICRKYNAACILHSFVNTAIKLKTGSIHLPFPLLRQMSDTDKTHFSVIGTSCHSAAEAIEAEKLGSTYITAGHIFATDCKKGVPARGLEFLQEVCERVSIPVYAIGGINRENYAKIRQAGAQGACVMSGLMCCQDVAKFMEDFEKEFIIQPPP